MDGRRSGPPGRLAPRWRPEAGRRPCPDWHGRLQRRRLVRPRDGDRPMIRRLFAVAATATVFSFAGVAAAPSPAAEAQVIDVKCLITPALCVAGELAGGAVGAVASSAIDGAADAFGEAAAWVIQEVFGWWLRTPSVSIESSGVLQLQGIMLGLAALVGVTLVTVQGIRMIVTRK